MVRPLIELTTVYDFMTSNSRNLCLCGQAFNRAYHSLCFYDFTNSQIYICVVGPLIELTTVYVFMTLPNYQIYICVVRPSIELTTVYVFMTLPILKFIFVWSGL